jgi:hypothetical protein
MQLSKCETQQVELELCTPSGKVQGQNLCFSSWKKTFFQDPYLIMQDMSVSFRVVLYANS